jgi:LacI family transcriptional regulator
VFAANDDMAAAVLSRAHTRGIKVPSELAVVGFDNSPIASQVWPAITTIDQPIETMASFAAEQLIQLIKAPNKVNGQTADTNLMKSGARPGEEPEEGPGEGLGEEPRARPRERLGEVLGRRDDDTQTIMPYSMHVRASSDQSL